MKKTSLTHSLCSRNKPLILGCVEEPNSVHEPQDIPYKSPALISKEGHVASLVHTA